jgi:thiaminase (transcriptional activator TenA)
MTDSLTATIRTENAAAWERVVTHPLVLELGDGTLPIEKFRTYFVQDYIFVKDLVAMMGLAIAKSPDLGGASASINRFLTGVLNPENDLFVRALKELNANEEELTAAVASPATQGFVDFLTRVGHEGTFDEIVTVLYVTEGTYLDWATRLIEAGRVPENPFYREWIDLHGPEALGDIVAWLKSHLDAIPPGRRSDRTGWLARTALSYELMFWEQAYSGEGLTWPQ